MIEIETDEPHRFPRECVVCGRRARFSVDFRRPDPVAVIVGLALQLVVLPAALLFSRRAGTAKLPLCLRHYLGHALPGWLLPLTVVVQLALLSATMIVLLGFRAMAPGLGLAAVTTFWIFFVTTAAHCAPPNTLPIRAAYADGRWRYKVAADSHFYERLRNWERERKGRATRRRSGR